MKEQGHSFNRRKLFSFMAGATAVVAAETIGDSVVARVPELILPSQSKIIFPERQKARISEKNSTCIVLGGSNFGSSKRLVDWLSPALEPLGAVAYVEYAKNGLDTPSIAKEIKRLKDLGITEISFYGHSLGTQVAGMVMQDLEGQGNDIRLKHIIMDCTPPSLAYTLSAKTSNMINNLPPEASITYLSNALVHGNPIANESSSPALLDEQLEALANGEQHLSFLASAVARHQSKVTLLTPETPEKDTLIDARRATPRLKKIFPSLHVEYIGGIFQQHGVSPKNLFNYYQALHKVVPQSV